MDGGQSETWYGDSFEIGVKPTFVIGLDEDGRPKPKRVKPQAYRGQITEH